MVISRAQLSIRRAVARLRVNMSELDAIAGRAAGNRRAERSRAFQIIYGLFFRRVESQAALAALYARSLYAEPGAEGLDEARVRQLTEAPEGFAWELVLGVWQRQAQLDEIIAEFSRRWRVERMGRVELALLRLAFHELLFCLDTPPKVIINEAIELSRLFGDDNSRVFVNGILDAVLKAVETGEVARTG